MTRTKGKCSHLTNNCLYFIKYHLETSSQDDIVNTVVASFNEEEIQTAYISIRELMPDTEIKDRSVKNLPPHMRAIEMFLWFKTAKNIHVFPDDPYCLPSLMSADSISDSMQAVAALDTSPTMKNPVEAGLTNDLSFMKTQLEEMKSLQKEMLDTFKNLNVVSDQLAQPPLPRGISPCHPPPIDHSRPRPSLTLQANGFPLTPASSSDGGEPDHKNEEGEREGGEEDSSSHPYAKALKSNMNVPAWRIAGGKKKPKPHLNPVNTHHPSHNDMSAKRRYEKRCHVAIHNLHFSVTSDDIKNRVNMLTGSDPLILHELPCKVRGQVAFRVSCHFQYLNVLVGENFGTTVKVSFYNLKRDQPRPPSPSVLGPVPSHQDLNSSVSAQGLNHSPNTSQVSISPDSPNSQDQLPSTHEISTLVSSIRTESD